MLSILGIVVIIVAAYQVYKAARDTGRNPVLWTIITLVAGFGIQIGLPIIAVMVYAVFLIASGTPEPALEGAVSGPATIIGVLCLFLSFVAVWIILKLVSKIPEDKSFISPPSPPTNFN